MSFPAALLGHSLANVNLWRTGRLWCRSRISSRVWVPLYLRASKLDVRASANLTRLMIGKPLGSFVWVFRQQNFSVLPGILI